MTLRKALLWILVPLLVVILIPAFLISPLGTPIVRYAAVTLVDGLSIDDIDGTVLSDFSISGVKWENDDWAVSADNVAVNAVLGCLWRNKVCIDYLTLNGVTVTQKRVAETTEPADDSPVEPLTLPLAIKLSSLDVTNLNVELQGVSIKLAALHTEGYGEDKLVLSPLTANGLFIHLPASAPDPQPTEPTSYALSYSAPALPDVVLPIPITIEDFALTDSKIQTGDAEPQAIATLSWQTLSFAKSDLAWQKLHLEHTLATVDTDGEVSLSGNYPLAMTLATEVKAEGLEESVELEAKGALNDLNIDIKSEGSYLATIRGQINALSDNLPVTLQIEWPEQPLPGVQDGQLLKGSMSLTGEMGQYQFVADSGAVVPEIGQVPVVADVVLTSGKVKVNSLTVDLLEGKITNTGTLFLDESLSWSGKTTLKNISTMSLSPLGPKDINGGFTSLMQLSDKGPEVSISDLNISGTKDNLPLSVTGALVYSKASDLLVTNMNVKQEDNHIRVAAQVFNERYLNADIDIDVAAINALYPDVSGAITGRIKASGDWSDPVASGTLNLADVQLSPTLSPLAAEQGSINGEIGIKGSLSDHNFNVDLKLPDHFVKLNMHGAWADQRYVADIDDSQLGLLTTRWNLSNPFRVAVRPEPFSMKISQHCWESREDGEMCIKDLLYKDERTKWIVHAQGLPLGLWAHELLPDTFTDNSDATLSLETTGEFGKNAPMTANFDLNVTPATWTMGPEQQLKLTSDKLTAVGTYKDDILDTSASFSSDQLGSIMSKVNVNLKEDDMPVKGNIEIDSIRISPFKPMSKAIRELAGELNGKLDVTGSVRAPNLVGDVALTNGNVDIEDMPVSIGDWQQTIHFDGKQANFDGSFLLGEGKGSLSGDVSWQDEMTANIKLKGKRFQVHQRDIRMQISPNLTASIKPNNVKVTGDVNIPWARVLIEDLPENAVSPSKDVHLRGEPPSEDPLDIVDATVMVNIDKDKTGEVKLEAFGLTANLFGGIEVRTHPALVGYGDLQILDGRYQAYGQDLVIQTGEVQFNGPLDQPMLLVEAIRDPNKTEDGVIAGIRIDGAADSPNINLFSEPAMNQSNSLSYLLTGRGPGASSTEPNYNALLLGFGLSSTEKIQGQLGSALGIEDFSVGTTSSAGGGSTKLSLNGRINDRLTVQYNVDVGLSSNNSSTQTLRRRQEPPDLALRYRLLPRLFVEGVQTTIEEQTEFAVDFYYEFFLGGPEDKKQETSEDADDQ